MMKERKLKTGRSSGSEWECTQSGKEGEPSSQNNMTVTTRLDCLPACLLAGSVLCGKGATTQTKLMIVNDGGGVLGRRNSWASSSYSVVFLLLWPFTMMPRRRSEAFTKGE